MKPSNWIRSASTRRLPSSVAATVVGEGSFLLCRLHERHRVVPYVRRDGLRDLPRPAVLRRDSGEPVQLSAHVRKRRSGSRPRLEEALLVRDQEPALAGLEVDDEPLEPVRRRKHLQGMPRVPRRVTQVSDREEQDEERSPND